MSRYDPDVHRKAALWAVCLMFLAVLQLSDAQICRSTADCVSPSNYFAFCDPTSQQCASCGSYDQACCSKVANASSIAGTRDCQGGYHCGIDGTCMGNYIGAAGLIYNDTVYRVYASEWSGCSVKCGTGTEHRTVLCLVNGTAAPLQACPRDGLQALLGAVPEGDTIARTCSLSSKCTGDAVVRVSPWGPCSKTCGGGVTHRNITCVNATTNEELDDSSCPGIGNYTKFNTSRACNTVPCSVAAWTVGNWSACEGATGGFGQQVRNVSCLSLNESTTLPATNCSQPQPPKQQLCSSCNTTSQPLADVCTGNGQYDRDGKCCYHGRVDYCGVCNGTATFVDDAGMCCGTVADASGRCCASGSIDESGVCDGVDAAPKLLVMEALVNATSDSNEAADMLLQLLQSVFTTTAASPNDTTLSLDAFNTTQTENGTLAQASVIAHNLTGITSAELLVLVNAFAGEFKNNGVTLLLSASTWLPTCGNGLCEFGERGNCTRDCAIKNATMLSCPAGCSQFNVRGESDYLGGVCNPLRGTCACHTWATGESCEAAAPGWAFQNGNRFSLVHANTTCAAPSPSSGTTQSRRLHFRTMLN